MILECPEGSRRVLRSEKVLEGPGGSLLDIIDPPQTFWTFLDLFRPTDPPRHSQTLLDPPGPFRTFRYPSEPSRTSKPSLTLLDPLGPSRMFRDPPGPPKPLWTLPACFTPYQTFGPSWILLDPS